MGLADGREFAQLLAPGGWTGEFSECPRGTADDAEPLVLEAPPHGLWLIKGRDPKLERVSLERLFDAALAG